MLKRDPVNVVGPFTFPEPDDPRWVADTDRPLVHYVLGAIHCCMYEWGGGFIMIDGQLLTDVKPEGHKLDGPESRYAMAVAKAYKKAYPEFVPKTNNRLRTKIVEILEEINRKDPPTP